MQKKLYKDPNQKMISGVLAGIADYIDIDVTIVRVLYVFLSVISSGFPGIILYIVLAVIMPTKEEVQRNSYDEDPDRRRRSTHYESGEKTYQDVNYKDVTQDDESGEKKSYTKSGGSYSSDE